MTLIFQGLSVNTELPSSSVLVSTKLLPTLLGSAIMQSRGRYGGRCIRRKDGDEKRNFEDEKG